MSLKQLRLLKALAPYTFAKCAVGEDTTFSTPMGKIIESDYNRRITRGEAHADIVAPIPNHWGQRS